MATAHVTARRAVTLTGAVALAAGLAACGGNANATAPTAAAVKTARIPGLGRVLVDGAGFTLYAYIPDRQGRSRCYGMCAHQWPPLDLVAGQARAVSGAGARPGLLGQVRRAGGARQVTYDGWPLYTYINDAAPGQATGQSLDMGAWYAISASGAIDRNPVRGTGPR